MLQTKPVFNITGLLGTLLSTFLCGIPVQAFPGSHAATLSTANPAFSSWKQLTFNAHPGDFAGDERPGGRTSGGSRGACLEQLIALVPGTDAIPVGAGTCETPSESLPTRTVHDTPTLWFYVPTPPASSAQPGAIVEFVLLDQTGQIQYTKPITVAETPGIVAVQTPSLQRNQSYQWVFSLLINARNPSQNPTVDGWVLRIEPDAALSQDLAQATSPQERIAAYASHGVWQDALTQLALLRQADPENPALLAAWHELLDSVGLGAIADAPLLRP